MSRKRDQMKAYSPDWKAGFLAAHEGLKTTKGGDYADVELFGLGECQCLLGAKEGYLRAGFGHDGLFWVRYKWTEGVLAGTYVFGSAHTLGLALAEAATAAGEVLAGKRKPSRDTGYRK